MARADQIRILLIEDDAGDALLLRELLKEADRDGFSIEEARRLAEGLERLRDGGYDIAMLDVSLPDAAGIDTVRRVREAAPDLPLLVLTGLEDPRFAATAGRAGAQDYIVKGQFSATALAQAIRHAIERHRLEETMRNRVAEIADLRRHERLQREFLANMSHELRTPIAAIRGAAETLRGGALADKKGRVEFVRMIESHADRLSRLIEELLLISELGGQGLRRVAVPVAPLVRAELEKIEEERARRKLAVSTKIEPGLRAVGDEKHFAEAVRALLRNAIDYNKEGGAVDVCAREENGQAVISVRDTGMGIAPASLPHIFDRFHRSPEARVLKPDATGLGLFIVKRIADAYGGRVWAESSEGRGSTFHLALPKAARS